MSNFGRNLALWVIIALLLVVLFSLFQPGGIRGSSNTTNVTQMAYSEFLNSVKQGNVKDVVIQDRNVSGDLKDGRAFQTYTPDDPSLVQTLTAKNAWRSWPSPRMRTAIPCCTTCCPGSRCCSSSACGFSSCARCSPAAAAPWASASPAPALLTEKQGRVTFEDVGRHRRSEDRTRGSR